MKTRRRTAAPARAAGAPFLHRIASQPDKIDRTRYPFTIRAFAGGIDLAFRSKVTFFVGENGSGKSTLLEALAECCGFNPEGGNRDHHRAVFADRSLLAKALQLSWLPKVTEGFFMRAESFYNFATYIEEVSDMRAYGGKSLHEQSHGESFMSLFANRFEQGIYILDEPEAALSPQRQLSFLKIIHDLTSPGHAQFLIATHSPIILSYPGAVLFSLDGDAIQEIDYRETKHFLITRDFLNSPERFFKHLFEAVKTRNPMPDELTRSDYASTVTDQPVYPTWIRSSRIVLFWLLAVGVIAIGVAVSFFWLPGLAIAFLALPFLYIAGVLTLVTHRLGPRGGDLQRRIHQLVIDAAGVGGRLLDVGCGSGQLLIRCAKAGPGEFVGLDYWGDDWEYSKAQAERNAQLENVPDLTFVHGSASRLPFPDGAFSRVVSSLTFHEVRDVADKTASLAEALRVLESGGRFAFVDLFDDPAFYQGRERVLDAVRDAAGEIESVRTLTDIFELKFPMNLGKVLKHAVIVTGTKSPGMSVRPPVCGAAK